MRDLCSRPNGRGQRAYGPRRKSREWGEHLMTATTLYREMGMTYWLEKAQREVESWPADLAAELLNTRNCQGRRPSKGFHFQSG